MYLTSKLLELAVMYGEVRSIIPAVLKGRYESEKVMGNCFIYFKFLCFTIENNLIS